METFLLEMLPFNFYTQNGLTMFNSIYVCGALRKFNAPCVVGRVGPENLCVILRVLSH